MAIVKDIDKGLKRIFKDLKEINKSFVKVGVLSSAKPEPDGMNMGKLANIMEYGSPSKNIPSRPFMRQTIDRIKEQIKKFNEYELKLIMQGKSTAARSLGRLGEFVQREIKKEFIEGSFEPNARSTLLASRRKHAKIKKKYTVAEAAANVSDSGGKIKRPLIETGALRGSINYEVVKK